mgnify:CR=1 FL=1
MSEPNKLEGTVKVIEDTQTFASGFSKREFVVTVEDGKYPQDIKLELVKDGVDKLTGIEIGDKVSVVFDIRGNEYKGKYYVNLVAWQLKQLESQPKQEQPSSAALVDETPVGGHDDEEEESIPF